ncbi:secretin N-terminal domain-containing protein [Thalassotalea castellviae]|uniref:Secretin N-terminal domain-containing protein n=1 Tax=Thalassotalea castellviae TaxID=3075612 RepID=A0ABU2ZY28_9GAMM|nr:secretin N-terminal domain-containing protein [Thalassotalea sp. W431]MDT0602809.1 secretin N-terminal domain-containing protein [Thalassotalea sp. W431]
MKKLNVFCISCLTVLILSACTSAPKQPMAIKESYLKNTTTALEVSNAELLANNRTAQEPVSPEFRFVAPMKLGTKQATTATDILKRFSESAELTIAADSLALTDYLHYVFGEQLKVSYIVADELKNDNQSVTLNLQTPISARKLFTLTEELLIERNYTLRVDDNIFYIHKNSGTAGKGDFAYGYGKNPNDVPQTSLEIIQMVPFEYGMQISLANTLRQLLGVTAIPDQQRNSLTIRGKRKEVVKALELVQIMDQPALQNRQIGIYQGVFLPTKDLISKITELLGQEGLSVGSSPKLALSVVELDKQGKLIFFANNQQVIERAVYWLKQIDKPILSADKQYFIYQPQYSRAVDMGESLEALIGGGFNEVSNSTSASNQNTTNERRRVRSASSADIKMVVDERANSIIFFTSGEEYQQLLPLINRLDVLPKQVVLEVMIAEVVLSDEFKSGVEFSLSNLGAAKVGGFNLTSGTSGLSYVLSGTRGQVSLELFQSNSNVNVLSRPSLLVRDGVTASINVGDSIPTVGETIFDANGTSRTSVVYRDTGISLSVTPTVNARGVIIMEIDQQTTGQADGGVSVAGSPVISERNIQTEVIAESGQTIVLGGLIKENKTKSDSSVPFFSSIPLVGKLFDSQKDSTTKTELVVLVTPRIIESVNEWEDIKTQFMQSFKSLQLEN